MPVAATPPIVRVYPRACGGTEQPCAVILPGWGLSPRVRGNRVDGQGSSKEEGSIPARAGEPSAKSARQPPSRVYPRACGGTKQNQSDTTWSSGLSPRVRGNRYFCLLNLTGRGSIPARAGEPTSSLNKRTSIRVYPRACGGTPTTSPQYASIWGLSPRVRGNRGPARGAHVLSGSIPARAGEPGSALSMVSSLPAPWCCCRKAGWTDSRRRILKTALAVWNVDGGFNGIYRDLAGLELTRRQAAGAQAIPLSVAVDDKRPSIPSLRSARTCNPPVDRRH